MKILSELFLRFSLIALLLAPFDVSAQIIDPKLNFSCLETTHFSIIFDSRHRLIAELYADYAEEAYETLIQKFNMDAPRKTIIFINDVSDQANGSAVGIPYAIITAYGVLPSPSEPVSDYGNWGRELLMHEFTHILNFEPANGVFSPLRYMFGNLVRPNMFLPRWYLEGLAVEEETEYSNSGRLRSANFTAGLRALSLDGLLVKENISRINEVSIPYWPFGARPYLMGSILWDEIVRSKDPGIIGRLNDRYSRRFPFFLTAPIVEETGFDFKSLLNQAYSRIETSVLKQKAKIEASSQFSPKSFKSQLGFDTNSPSLSPDRLKLLLVTHNEEIESLIELRERKDFNQSFSDIEPRKIVEGTAIGRASWLGNSNEFVYESLDTHGRYNHYSDLYKYNLETKKRDRLTNGIRARDAAVSPDGQRICFVQLDTALTRLACIPRDGEKGGSGTGGNNDSVKSGLEVFYSPELQIRISHPEFLSNSEIVFSERDSTGREVLKIFNLISHSLKDLLPDYSPMHYAKLTPLGLLFESEKSGVANIYLTSQDLKTVSPITNVITSASTAELDSARGELLVTLLSGKGQNVAAIDSNIWSNQPKILPQVAPLINDHWKRHTPPTVQVEKKIEDYSPWSYLIPRYWMPYFYFLPGGSYVSASTTAGDPVGHHAYSLLASYDTLSSKPSIFATYTNATIATPLTFNLFDYYEYIYAVGYIRHSTVVNPYLTSFIPGLNNNYTMGGGWSYFQSAYPGANLNGNGPGFFFNYSDISKRGLQISPEKGGTLYLAYNSYLPNIGNVSYDELKFRGSFYFSKYLPKHHVLASSLNLYYAPRLDHLLNGRTTSSAVFQQNILDSSFVLRGYPYGALIGHNLYTANLEYRFPIRETFEGYGVKPLFFQKYYGALFTDVTTADGAFYSIKNLKYDVANAGRYFVGSGLELKVDTTMFYQIPVTWTLGLYYGFDKEASYGFTPFMGFTL